jgi:hypothetical protein
MDFGFREKLQAEKGPTGGVYSSEDRSLPQTEKIALADAALPSLYSFSWVCDVLPFQFRASASILSSLQTASLLTVVSELLLLRWRFSYLTFPWHPRELKSWHGGS